MAHDQKNITVTRFDGGASGVWDKAITPSDRQWMLYVDTIGRPYLYLRVDDVEDAATGDRLERYLLSWRPEPPCVPENLAPPDILRDGAKHSAQTSAVPRTTEGSLVLAL